ncbi:ImmA/IrrE family metallo-endopeptidase [Clostridium tyrobutyricum]|uniref:ImmA/IrrE family metallo-endopeptidase n=1 Tax=Clostridium tyrobutyricum TaxID=1519 RepID=UPI001C393FDB|nr:ImmA/IrrE family metallo-endopeptidase [Clostridium tyrobutyricum]MBV4427204.1 ImmA/IrrE family metallo-endopeptidase [Clostridium tyrobutyricum]MBV4442461.1 ImmA/IrrE family metallo-endopeptidase [Clostridium tyrobutyricum]
MPSTVAKPRSRRDIRKLTVFIRSIYDKQTMDAFPIMDFLEHMLPQIIEDFEWHILYDEQMEDCDGKTFPQQNKIYLKESVYDGACAGNPRDRFTVAHEIGHLLLHNTESISYARSNKQIKAYENPEWQANTFAAELLIPVDSIKYLSPIQIAHKFKVSLTAAKIQLNYVN